KTSQGRGQAAGQRHHDREARKGGRCASCPAVARPAGFGEAPRNESGAARRGVFGAAPRPSDHPSPAPTHRPTPGRGADPPRPRSWRGGMASQGRRAAAPTGRPLISLPAPLIFLRGCGA
ncbi:unnamed protein product, partial [Amoebophrya sp. A120]